MACKNDDYDNSLDMFLIGALFGFLLASFIL
jgi:hypothetical protein